MGLADLLSVTGGLEKLRITAFTDADYTSATLSYLVMYNPTTFSQNWSAKWLDEKNVNPNSKEKAFRANKSGSVSFEFLFDATGASPASQNRSGTATSENKALAESAGVYDVATEIKNSNADPGLRHVDDVIKKFFELAYTVQGDQHQPSHLQINWGAFEFRGVLESASVNYKLFNSSGLPIRATLSVTFSESITKTEQAAEDRLQSPDLTHYRIVKEGDNLPLISKRIYGSPDYYVQLAKVNKLANFRKLRTGERIIVPPIDKNSKPT